MTIIHSCPLATSPKQQCDFPSNHEVNQKLPILKHYNSYSCKKKHEKKINQQACCYRIWSWSPMPCEKHGPRASVTTKTEAEGLGFCLLSPSGHVFHTAWETMIKSYSIFLGYGLFGGQKKLNMCSHHFFLLMASLMNKFLFCVQGPSIKWLSYGFMRQFIPIFHTVCV